MAVFPEPLPSYEGQNLYERVQTVETYIRYLVERMEYVSSCQNQRLSACEKEIERLRTQIKNT